MEIWLDIQSSKRGHEFPPEGIDTVIDGVGGRIEANKLYIENTLAGAVVHIDGKESQDQAKALIGSVNWLVLSFESWSMIPLENLIAANEGTPTRIAAQLTTAAQIQGAAFALEQGVDAVFIPDEAAMIESAMIAKSQRLERRDSSTSEPEVPPSGINLEPLNITSVEEGGIGERYCIDFTSLLNVGEGMLVGSNASSFMLVHGETIPSEFVPSRPFRVNAGSPQSYALMADGTTKYLAELQSGDSVTITDRHGQMRQAVIGRLKVEQRPLLLFRWMNENHKGGHMFLQQAETVRAVDLLGNPLSVTSLVPGDRILGWSDHGGRHIGVTISSLVSER